MKDQSIIKHLIIIFAVIFFWGSVAFCFSGEYLIAIIFFIFFIFLRMEYEKIRKDDQQRQAENEHE